MSALRIVAATLIYGGFVLLLGRTVLSGLRSGRVARTDSSSFCWRRDNPLGYWALIVLFSGMVLGCIFAWVQVMWDVFLHSS